ncbi:MAG: dTDP-4-dehydrorhamnose 3,5-epimerase family protein [Acidimicrobiia bacterium]
MRLVETPVVGCYEVQLDPSSDVRGSFLKEFQSSRFAEAGIPFDVREVFTSRSHTGVVRGLHFQRPPADVAKLVCCLDGVVLDAVVDLRVDSPSYRQHALVALSSDVGNAMYVPEGCAHGFFVVRGDALVMYAQSGEHHAQLEGGIHWSSADVPWPTDVDVVLSTRDEAFPALDEFESPFRLGT